MFNDDSCKQLDRETWNLIRSKAAQMTHWAGFLANDREDLEQDLAIELLRRAPAYSPQKGTWLAFVNKVLQHAAADIARHRRAARRGHHKTKSLHGLVPGEPEGPTELGTTLSQREQDARRLRHPRDQEILAQLRLDMEEVLSKLPFRLRWLAELLKHHSAAEIARRLRLPRTTVQDAVGRLRRHLARSDLRHYLDNPPSPRAPNG
jgi:RNA polymerase sigma-70 factor (ECF subfamily)